MSGKMGWVARGKRNDECPNTGDGYKGGATLMCRDREEEAGGRGSSSSRCRRRRRRRRGLVIWLRCGCQYDGQFVNGLAHGSGVHTWANGHIYVGHWNRGLKHGHGKLFIPLVSKLPNTSDHHHHHHHHHNYFYSSGYGEQMMQFSSSSSRRRRRSSSDIAHIKRYITSIIKIGKSSRLSLGGRSSDYYTPSESSEDSNENSQEEEDDDDDENSSSSELFLSSFEEDEDDEEEEDGRIKNANLQMEYCSISNYSTTRPAAITDKINPIARAAIYMQVEMEFSQGVLIRQFVKDENISHGNITHDHYHKSSSNSMVSRLGKAMSELYRQHHHTTCSSQLLFNLQLGIRTSLKRVLEMEQEQQVIESAARGFGGKDRVSVNFGRGGGSADFKWKDYCPLVFRKLREVFNISTVDYVQSICSSNGLRELSSPGNKSGSAFYLSHDDRFLIKTVRQAEMKVFLGMLGSYYEHVRKYPNTLITKFLGLHEIKPANGRKVYFVVMLYLFPKELQIHQRFDLKGSSQGRSVAAQNSDRARIRSEKSSCTLKDLDLNLVFRLEPSCRQAFLRQIDVDTKFLESENIMDYSLLLGVHFQGPQLNSRSDCRITSTDGIMDANGRRNSETLLMEEMELADKSAATTRSVGWNMRGRAEMMNTSRIGEKQSNCKELVKHEDDHEEEAYEVSLYVGIIDVLQRYNMSKRMEHAYKCLHYNSLSISAVDPIHYSKRFQNFITHIFLTF